MIQWLKIGWAVFKLAKRIYRTYLDEDPKSSKYKANALRGALEAVEHGDILKLHSAIVYFDRLPKS